MHVLTTHVGYRAIQDGRLVKLNNVFVGKGKGKESVEWMYWVHG